MGDSDQGGRLVVELTDEPEPVVKMVPLTSC